MSREQARQIVALERENRLLSEEVLRRSGTEDANALIVKILLWICALIVFVGASFLYVSWVVQAYVPLAENVTACWEFPIRELTRCWR